MRKTGKILLGVLTLAPLALMILAFVFFFTVASSASFGRRFDEDAFSVSFGTFFAIQMLAVLLTLGLTVFYIVNVFRNDRVEKDKKALWAVVIFMGNAFAMPVYWYLFIWPEREEPGSGWRERVRLNNADAAGWGANAASRDRSRDYVPPPPPPDWR